MGIRHFDILMATSLTILHLTQAQNGTERKCYWADGSPADGLVSCFETRDESHCCGASGSCLSNGYCWAVLSNVMYRPACTDSSWSSEYCPQNCKHTSPSTSLAITKAGTANFWDSLFCCGTWNGSTCASEPFEPFHIDTGRWINDRATGSTEPNSTTLTTATVTATAEPSQRTNNNLPIGLGVGLSLGLLLLGTVAYAWLLRRQVKSLRRNANAGRAQDFPTYHADAPQMADQSATFLRRGQPAHEIYTHPVGELEGRDLLK